MAINNTDKQHSLTHMGNASFDKDLQMNMTEGVGFDGKGLVKQEADDLQIKIVNDGTYTYICKARVGTAESEASWKIYRIDATGNKMYADADLIYNNIATDPTILTYSYS
jgi:hypothetical protein